MLLAIGVTGAARANPLPCPESSLKVDDQTVSFEIFDCGYDGYGYAIDASGMLRMPTTDQVTDPSYGYQGSLRPCPEVDKPTDVSFRTCSQSFLSSAEEGYGDIGSGAEGGYFVGVCGDDACVPPGRWKYVVRLEGNTWDCYSFVVEVTTDAPYCRVDKSGCAMGGRSSLSALGLLGHILLGVATMARRSRRS